MQTDTQRHTRTHPRAHTRTMRAKQTATPYLVKCCKWHPHAPDTTMSCRHAVLLRGWKIMQWAQVTSLMILTCGVLSLCILSLGRRHAYTLCYQEGNCATTNLQNGRFTIFKMLFGSRVDFATLLWVNESRVEISLHFLQSSREICRWFVFTCWARRDTNVLSCKFAAAVALGGNNQCTFGLA